jgi:outer membrane receptor protein involved in Fe transport
VKSLVNFQGSTLPRLRNQEYGAFIEDRVSITPRLQVQLGLRYDRERVVHQEQLSRRELGFSFLPFGTARSKLSGGVGLFTTTSSCRICNCRNSEALHDDLRR